MSPFDWQEALGQRAQFVESRLSQGVPVAAQCMDDGILFVTWRRQIQKVYEIYDCLALSGMGQPADVDAIRTAAIEFCHQEGYRRSEEDVTLHRLLNAISKPMKAAFADPRQAPMVAQLVLGEIGESCDEDRLVILEWNGDFIEGGQTAIVASTADQRESLHGKIEKIKVKTLEKRAQGIADAIREVVPRTHEDLIPEAALLDRTAKGDRKLKPIELA